MAVEDARSTAELRRRFAQAERELAEAREGQTLLQRELAEARKREAAVSAREAKALEQQTATSEILRVIASSPTDLQLVLDSISEHAARLCDANDAIIHRVDGEHLQFAAHYGLLTILTDRQPIGPDSPVGRAMLDRRTVHVHDLAKVAKTEFPAVVE